LSAGARLEELRETAAIIVWEHPMRFVNTSLILSLTIPHTLTAQYIGMSLGRAASTVDWQYPAPPAGCIWCPIDVLPAGSRQAMTPAVVLQWHATHWFGASSELRLAPKGFAISQPTLRVEYLQVPLLFRMGRIAGRRAGLRPFLEAGPGVALRVRCRVSYTSVTGDVTEPCARDATVVKQDWRFTRLDLSALAGAGLAVHVRRTLVLVGGRVDWGLRDIGGPEPVPTKHRTTLVYVSGLVPIGSVLR
jgi:hypothetical protein